MGDVGDLVGHEGAAAAGMFGPAVHAGLKEGAVDDELTAAVEQVEQARLALGPVELVLLLHGEPRHPPTLGGQRITGAGQGLLLHEELLARSLPLLRRNDRGCVHREMPFQVLHVSLLVPVVLAAEPAHNERGDAARRGNARGDNSHCRHTYRTHRSPPRDGSLAVRQSSSFWMYWMP
jgi:hypothetical protein